MENTSNQLPPSTDTNKKDITLLDGGVPETDELLAILASQDNVGGQVESMAGFHWLKIENGLKHYYVLKKDLDAFEDSDDDLEVDGGEVKVPSFSYTDAEVRAIGKYMLDLSNPLKARMRALFALRNIATPLALEVMSEGFGDESVVLKHEIAYCMGQTQLIEAIPYLQKLLENSKEHQIVRHEAVEALGAIGTSDCAYIVLGYIIDESQVVRDSVKLALSRIGYLAHCKRRNRRFKKNKRFHSVDPAFPLRHNGTSSVCTLENILLDPKIDIYTRYGAMFALRNIGSPEAIAVLCKGLDKSADENPLFKHEIAFVFGQLQNAQSEAALTACLLDETQDEMVRHECAEALGAIGTSTAAKILQPLAKCDNRIVRESVEIALDINEYEMGNYLEYCNGADLMK